MDGGNGSNPNRNMTMKQIVKAVYENGVFRPVTPIDVPQGQEVILEIEPIEVYDPKDGSNWQEPRIARLPPELLEWARQQYTEEEVVAALREMREKGGPELRPEQRHNPTYPQGPAPELGVGFPVHH